LTSQLTKSRIRPDAQCVDGKATKSLGYNGNVGDGTRDTTEWKALEASEAWLLEAAKR